MKNTYHVHITCRRQIADLQSERAKDRKEIDELKKCLQEATAARSGTGGANAAAVKGQARSNEASRSRTGSPSSRWVTTLPPMQNLLLFLLMLQTRRRALMWISRVKAMSSSHSHRHKRYVS